jgi:hypothetical protein
LRSPHPRGRWWALVTQAHSALLVTQGGRQKPAGQPGSAIKNRRLQERKVALFIVALDPGSTLCKKYANISIALTSIVTTGVMIRREE